MSQLFGKNLCHLKFLITTFHNPTSPATWNKNQIPYQKERKSVENSKDESHVSLQRNNNIGVHQIQKKVKHVVQFIHHNHLQIMSQATVWSYESSSKEQKTDRTPDASM